MSKFTLRVATGVFLILISSISIFSQQHYDPQKPQIVDGCSAIDTRYPPRTFIYDSSGNLVPVDRVVTGYSRFIFTVRPDQGFYAPGQPITFTVSNYGREKRDSHDPGLPDPPSTARPAGPAQINPRQTEESFALNRVSPLERLDLARYSKLPEDNNVILNWNESYLKSVTSPGPWYAIYKYAGETRPDSGTYLAPIEKLPADRDEIDVWPNPEDHFSYRGLPKKDVDPIKYSVRKLSGLEFDTTGLKPGYYWFTLQSEANFGYQKCQKTTPPVLIEISSAFSVTLEPRTIGPVSFRNASTHTVTAYISGGIGTVNLNWSRSSDDVDVSDCPTSTESNIVTCQVTTKPGKMVEGRNIKVRVDATNGDRKDDCEPYCTDIKVNRLPRIEVTVTSEDCKTVTATAQISDDDIPAQPLSLEWKVEDQKGNPVSVYPGGAGGTVVVLEKKDLKLGTYTFKGTVFDTLDYSYDDASTRYICEGGLGLVYFQFEVPDLRKPGKVINPKKPEGWAGGDPNGKDDKESNPYPSAQFPLFYSTTGAQEPVDTDMNNNNTKWMEVVVDMLHDNPAYLLKIFGYADFEGKPPIYDNEALGMRRAKAVRNYLLRRYMDKYGKDISVRIVRQAVVETRGARFAQSCDPYKWTDPRRWDRRAEMFLTKDRYADAPDYPKVDPCPRQPVYRRPAGYRKPAKPRKRR